MTHTGDMKPKTRRIVHWCVALPALLGGSSCAVFSLRMKSWEKQVTRTPEGVLDFAQPFSVGEGDVGLLLVHGFGDGPHVWEPLASALSEEGYHVRALRLPAWGEPASVKQSVTLADWEEHIQAEAEALRATCSRVVVLAHSMGGCLSTVLAQSGRLPADALILYAPMFEVSSARSPLLPTATWQRLGHNILPEHTIIESLFPDHSRRGHARPRTRRDPFVPARIYDLLFEEMSLLYAQPAVLPLPLRLVLPGEDHVVHSPRAQAWFEALQAPVKTLFIDEGAGHVLPLDLDARAEADRIKIWLNEIGI